MQSEEEENLHKLSAAPLTKSEKEEKSDNNPLSTWKKILFVETSSGITVTHSKDLTFRFIVLCLVFYAQVIFNRCTRGLLLHSMQCHRLFLTFEQ